MPSLRQHRPEPRPQPQLVPPRGRKIRKVWWTFGILALILLIGSAAVFILLRNRDRKFSISRDYVINFLQAHYDADVQLGKLSIVVYPTIQISGENLVIRRRMQPANIPAFITIRTFTAEVDASGLMADIVRVRSLRIEGFEINVPPRAPIKQPEQPRGQTTIRDFIIDDLQADGTVLRVYSQKPGKEPMKFEIQRLRLHSAGTKQPLLFDALLTNPTPPGTIVTQGSFGPWRTDEPRLTPLSGKYNFSKADLSVFKGISGILTSAGNFEGVLERIAVNGETDTPDFAVGTSGHPVQLKTNFNAVVDGTSGETLLQPVKAQFRNTTIVANGGVINRPGTKGKTIALNVRSEGARIEDLVQLVTQGESPLTGIASLQSSFVLPPGKQDVVQKLSLIGQFSLAAARFTDPEVQRKILTLSRRGRGINKEEELGLPRENLVSNLAAAFHLRDGVMSFTRLSFDVPGAAVVLHGTYGLRDSNMDFKGELRLQAKASETTSGIKSLLLKPFDPLFGRGPSGTVLPIKVTGTRGHPEFGLDKGRLLRGR
jgi:hypothetical protein